MIKKIAWETFKNTGDINTYLEFKQIEELEKGIKVETEAQNINLNNKTYENNINKNYQENIDKENGEKGEITKWQT